MVAVRRFGVACCWRARVKYSTVLPGVPACAHSRVTCFAFRHFDHNAVLQRVFEGVAVDASVLCFYVPEVLCCGVLARRAWAFALRAFVHAGVRACVHPSMRSSMHARTHTGIQA